MSQAFNVQSTSTSSAKVEDIWLNPPDDPDSALTRRVVRSDLVDNIHSDEARVKICIVHQKRHKKSEPWEDVDAFNLATLKAGQEVKLQLGAAETYHLLQILERLHAITERGIPRGNQNLAVVDAEEAVIVRGRAAGLVRKLTEEASEEFWNAVQELQPSLFRAIALTKLHELREQAVKTFQERLNKGDWTEPAWQDFFEKNTWIFGYGLSYQFLSPITAQPNYGGTLVTGRGGQRGDFLAASSATRRFTVLVEIKKPNSLLVEDELYRNKVHVLGEDLVGGVTQLQSNCRTWETQGSRGEDNRELLDREACYTIQPKGILVIGHTEQLDTNIKRTTFELFRRNLQTPEIITFDELLDRARHLLLNEEKHLPKGAISCSS